MMDMKAERYGVKGRDHGSNVRKGMEQMKDIMEAVSERL